MKKIEIYIISALLLGAVWLTLAGKIEKNDKELCPYKLISQAVQIENKITVDDLAKKLMTKDPSIVLIDVRSADEFKKFSLSGAINIPLEKLLADDNLPIINQEVNNNIFYSNGSDKAAKAWLICNRLGYKNNFYLSGGLNSWIKDIIKATPPEETASKEDFELYNSRKAASIFFGGGTVGESNNSSAAPAAASSKPLRKKESAGGGCN
ncbi:MAG: hypothetical protein AUJ98_10290 [Bacteroidetes bacterium CG2_30_33_31]|nr:MAG: hypothetical protein AUJ98_10290 [Bacteroidetes bacterium CG2_30_33_31]